MAAAEDVVTESNGGVSTGGGDDDATARAATIAMMTADGAAPLMDNVGAFAGIDDASLADEEWLARALAAASSAGLVGDADAVASDLAALSFAHEMEEDAKNQRAPDKQQHRSRRVNMVAKNRKRQSRRLGQERIENP